MASKRSAFASRNLLLLPLTFLLHLSAALPGYAQTDYRQADQFSPTTGVRARVVQPVDVQNLVPLRGNVHPLARPEFDQGAAPDDLPMERMLLVLRRGDDQETALRQLLEDQQVKSSASYHAWLAPEEFGQRFGPADADIQAVTDWLTGQGFQVSQVAAGRTVIEFSGTAGLVRQGLGTEIHRFAVNGKDYWANASDPQIPAALAPVVAGIASLNNFPRKPLSRNLGAFSRSKLTGEVQPLFTVPSSSGTYYLLGPWDFATIYNLLPLWNVGTDGTGQTIAVVGETNMNISDVESFRNLFGLPANDPNVILNGPDPGIIEDEPEADLDVEWTGAVAKGATIDLVVSESTEATYGVDLSALYIVDNNLAPVMSESYGACEAYLGTGGNLFYSTLWEQAAAQGITVVIASGDRGSAVCDAYVGETAAQYGLAVSGFASTPFNVAVGGTDFDDVNTWSTYWNASNSNTSTWLTAKSYIPESTWNDSCARSGLSTSCATVSTDGSDLIAGSGGPSNCVNSTGTFPSFTCTGGNSKPSWQTGTGVPNDGARDLPDLSLFSGDGFTMSFYVTCEADAVSGYPSCDPSASEWAFSGAGGTSASAQVFAGIMALVNQKYGRQGNANYVLYPLAATNPTGCNSTTTARTNSSCIFYDVTKGNNSVACVGGSPNCSNTSTAADQYGIMVNPLSPTTPAWMTTAGYDSATGLGSVNIANLANKWNTVSFTPSTTTLSLSTAPPTNPISLTHGQSINLSVQVAPKPPATGTPTGDVSLIAQTSSYSNGNGGNGIGSFPLSGGSISSTTNMLPAGSYNVVARYAGDRTYGGSDSNAVPVTVSTESSLTKVALVTYNPSTQIFTYGATSATYGSPYVLRVDVTNSGGTLCAPSQYPNRGVPSYPCPTGTVTVTPPPTDQGAPSSATPGVYALNSQGYAEDQYIQLPGGTYNFVASYAGDSSYTASSSPTVPVTITKASTTTTLSGLPSTVVGGFLPILAARLL
jgi:subtilase family serine protease